jgi:uncharacterized integral membrane protein
MNIVRLLLALLVAALLVVLGAQNTQSVSFHFVAWETPAIPVVLALAVALLLGVILAWVVSVPGRFRGMRSNRRLRHQIEDQERLTPTSSHAEAVDPEEPLD